MNLTKIKLYSAKELNEEHNKEINLEVEVVLLKIVLTISHNNHKTLGSLLNKSSAIIALIIDNNKDNSIKKISELLARFAIELIILLSSAS